MKKISKLLILFALSFLIGSQTLAVSTDCNWVAAEIVTNSSGGTEEQVCPANTEAGSKCTGTQGTDQLCCCNILAKPVEARFIIPDFKFQVPIPGVELTNVQCTDKCAIPWISEYFFGIYNYLLGIAAVIAVVILMAAGLLWIVSGGDATKVGQAKTMIAGSITGLLLLVSISLLLNYINPDLAKQGFVELTPIERKEVESLAVGRRNNTAETFKNAGCATDAELKAGVLFYATGYYKPKYDKNNKDFWCIIAMQCSCPNGVDTTQNCDRLYGKTFPNYHPCKEFPEGTPYCNMTSSGSEPQIGTVAGPPCGNLPKGTQICFKGTTYTVTDSGGGIKGKRIDIWSGNSLSTANAHTGTGTLTKGACPQ
jgi:hypothetical protein